MSDKIAVHIQTVRKSYQHIPILQHISLDIRRNEIFGLLGPSGAGKTTLVKCIVGIERVTSGILSVFDVMMPNLDIAQRIGYMAQSDALYNDCTAYENLKFFATLNGLTGRNRDKRITEMMDLLHLSQDLHKKVSYYSGGMKRRLSLAIALLHEPEILILDEPTVGIDPLLRRSIWAEFTKLQQQGITIIITTHVMDEAYKCGRLAMIRDGQLIAVGTPQELMEKHNTTDLETAFLAYGGVK